MLLSTTGTGASSYSNDADGNTLTGGGRTNTRDSQNRLVSCIITGSSSTFKYGADGLRRQKTTNGTTTDYAYDSTMMVREGVASGGTLSQVKATYLCGPRGPEYRRDDTQTEIDSQGRTVTKARWYVYDGLGSVVGEVDPLGNLTSSPKYDVYGAVRGNGGTATSKQGFVGGLGHLSEPETGLIYMRARYMDPTTGRFISQDPALAGENWFIYVRDNPINGRDKTGKIEGEDDLNALDGTIYKDVETNIENFEFNDAYVNALRQNGYSKHGAERFYETFYNIFGKNAKPEDGIDLLSKWNPSKAFENSHGNWQQVIGWRNVLIDLVLDDPCDGEVVTVF